MRLLNLLERIVFRLLSFVFRYRFLSILTFVGLIAVYVATFMPTLQKDGRVEAFMHADDPALTTYYDMRREFGQDNRLVIAVTAPDVFDRDFLQKFSDLHQELAQDVPYISEIFSAYNIAFIEHEDGGIYLEELVRNLLMRGRNPAELRERVTSTPLYRNFIISDRGDTLSIVIEPYRYAPVASDCVPDPSTGATCTPQIIPEQNRPLLGAPQYAEMTAAARQIIAGYQAQGFDVHMAGAPVVSTEIVKMMDRDMPRFMLAALIITVLTVYLTQRSLLVSVGAILSFLSALFVTMATLAASGTPMTPPTQLLIPMTLVVVLCSYIHFTGALIRARGKHPDPIAALRVAIEHCHTPIFFAAVTTAGGMVGVMISPLAPITALGKFGMVSVGASYFSALFWATIAFRFLPERFFSRDTGGPGLVVRLMERVATASARAPVRTLALCALLIPVVAVGLSRVEYSHNSLLWLPVDNEARVSTEFIDSRFHGSVNLELIIAPKGGRDFRDQELLTKIESTARAVYDEISIPVGRHTSMISFIEEINQALNNGDPAARILPGQAAIWEQIMLLEGQGSDDMKRYVTLDYTKGRVTFQVPWMEAKLYAQVIDTIQTRFQQELGDMADVQATGLIALLAQTSTALLDSITESYAVELALVMLCMILALSSVGIGVVAMVPILVPFLILTALMGYAGIPLDTFTILIAGILIGIIIDETFHFVYSVRRNLQAGIGIVDAVRATVLDIGSSLATAAGVVMLAFAIFMMSGMANIRAFGMLMAIGSGLALLADVIIAPAALALYLRRKQGVTDPDQTGSEPATA